MQYSLQNWKLVECYPIFQMEKLRLACITKSMTIELDFERRDIWPSLKFSSFFWFSRAWNYNFGIWNDVQYSSLSVSTHNPKTIHTLATIICKHLAATPPTVQLRDKKSPQIDTSPHNENPGGEKKCHQKDVSVVTTKCLVQPWIITEWWASRAVIMSTFCELGIDRSRWG